METTTLQAEVREERGKGPARRLRAEGKLPAVFYGPGIEPTPLTLSPKEIEKALRSDRGRNVVFKLSVNGKDELAMTRDVSTDPVTQELLHVDLYRVFEDKEIEVKIPFRVRGRAIGVVQGGILNVTRHYLPVRTTPAKMPASIDVDVTDLDLKQTISLEDLEFPEGVECTLPRKLTLVIVLEARLVVEEEPTVEAAEAAPGEVAEGAAEPEAPEAAAAEDEKASS